jgi:hypothetical protein
MQRLQAKIPSTAFFYSQFCVSQDRICCLSDNFIFSPYAVSGLYFTGRSFPSSVLKRINHERKNW